MNVSKKSIFVIFNMIFFIAIVNFIFSYISASKDISNIKRQEKIVLNQIHELEIKREQKKQELQSLNDDKTIERIARDKLNMKKKGEIIYRFINE